MKKNKVNVECIELDPRALLSQCYAVYCMKNNGTLNSTLNHLLLEKFVESETYLTSTVYTKARIENEFGFFKKFISGKLKEENARRVFENILELTKSGDRYQRKLPKFDTNPSIIFELFENGIKPAYPDVIYNNEFYSKSFTIGKKYDAVMSNNVFEHSAGGNFFSAAANVLKEKGLCEVTLVKGGHIDEINFENIADVENAGNAHMVYDIYKNLKCTNYLSVAVPLGKNVLILRKR